VSYRAAPPPDFHPQRLDDTAVKDTKLAASRADFKDGPFAIAAHDLRLDEAIADLYALCARRHPRRPNRLHPSDDVAHCEIRTALNPLFSGFFQEELRNFVSMKF